ncbi:MAG TPA: MlaD family protein [Ferruginibacter sp.]|jgi:phospholipid/cholesterol/gamma-HCH transport system substrate-binding protein|nr:MlaD family protein [Ferruginibacter sp.]
MKKEGNYKWKLGMFVTIGLLLFIVTIYLVGKQKNLFGSTFKLKTVFRSVSGLQEGNNVRFDGINIGTIDNIQIMSDTAVLVDMVVQKDVQRFIKKDATASIGSDGLMGDKVLVIGPGTATQPAIEENAVLNSQDPINMEEIMASLSGTATNAKLITDQLTLFTYKMNNNNGILHKLMGDQDFANDLKSTMSNLQASSNNFAKFTDKINSGQGAIGKLTDPKFANKLDSTLTNLQSGTKGLSDNMEAAKHNVLLRGYFRKKKKEDAKRNQEIQDSIRAVQQSMPKTHDSQSKGKPDTSKTIVKDSTVSHQ